MSSSVTSAKKNKILFINLAAFSIGGGIEKFNKSFLKALSDIGGNSSIQSQSLSLHDTDVDENYFLKKNYKGFRGNKFLFVFKSVLKAAKFDHIIIGHINLAIVGYLIKCLYPTKKLTLITHGIEVWKPLTGVKKTLLQKADVILTVSNFTKSKLTEVQKINQQKITVFHNTIDPFFVIPTNFEINLTLRKRYRLSSDDFVLFTLTRLSSAEKYKGYDLVIKSLPDVLKKIPHLKYVIGGKADENEKQRLIRLVKELQLEDVVIFLGFIKETEVNDHYQMADLFIMPSLGEGFGIVFIESMVCGIPVIAGNKDGSVEAVMNGELGMLVDPNNIQEIIEKVQESYDNRLLWKQNTQLCLQQKTLQHFGFNKYKAKLETLILQ